MSEKIYEMITQKIIEALENGTIPWKKPWVGGEHVNLISKKSYRGINVFILGSAGFISPYWLTFKQATEKGGRIKKGSKGCPIIFWNWDRSDKKKGDQDEVDSDKPTKKAPLLRYYTVFNLDQCEGITPPKGFEEREFTNKIVEAENIIENMPHCPKILHLEPYAYYSPAKDFVNMPRPEAFFSDEEYYSTLFHELVHSTGHKSRLNRRENIRNHMFGSRDYSKEELVAEMGAAFLCGITGIEPSLIENQAAYIESWLESIRGDKKMLIHAAANAQKAADFILNKEVAHDEQ